jgi:Protein of unknown function (DUF1236)
MRIIRRLVPIVALAAFIPAAALAQSAAGAGAGGIIGGPVGAPEPSATGSKIAPPPPNVVEYVTKAAAPAAITMPGNLVVGATLPKDVMLTQVPLDVYTEQSPATFAYANINGHKVIVDNATLKVVDILG